MCESGSEKIIEIARRKVAVDSCIADLIVKLNELGIITLESCCGHDKKPLYILFGLDGKTYKITEFKY